MLHREPEFGQRRLIEGFRLRKFRRITTHVVNHFNQSLQRSLASVRIPRRVRLPQDSRTLPIPQQSIMRCSRP